VTSPTDAYFETLSQRGHVPALRNRQATIRFDVDRGKQTDSWTVAVDKGDLDVSSEPSTRPPDCVIRTDQQLFDDLLCGRANAMAAMLRGALLADGDVELLVETRRLLPLSDEETPS
jgi:putative sterol carrier protein